MFAWSTRRRISKLQRRIDFFQSCHSRSSCPVMLLLELLPSRVTPGALAGELLSYSGVWFTSSRVTPGSPDQSCHFRSSCSVLPLLALFRSLVTPGASHVTAGALAQSCHSWRSCPVMDFWSSFPVMSLPEFLPSHVTPRVVSQSCHSWSCCRRISNLRRRITFVQS